MYVCVWTDGVDVSLFVLCGQAVYHDIREVAWNWGWDIYNYFATVGSASTYGCWGATEDFQDLDPGPPKLQAIYNLTGTNPTTIAEWALNPSRERAHDVSRPPL